MPAIIIQVKDIKLIKFDLTMLRIFQYLFKWYILTKKKLTLVCIFSYFTEVPNLVTFPNCLKYLEILVYNNINIRRKNLNVLQLPKTTLKLLLIW